MITYDINDIIYALSSVNIEQNDVLLVHSSLFQLGRYTNNGSADICNDLVDLLIQKVGKGGTLVVPAFNFDFCNGILFDRWNTPSKGMGVLSETIRTWPDAQRSKHPMQSVAAIGQLAVNICKPDTSSAFAINGPFDEMKKNRAKLLFIGAPFQSASLIHYPEEHQKVPYRNWKTFTALYIDHKIQEKRQYDMYVRDFEIEPKLDLSILQDEMDSRGLLAKARLGMGYVISCSFEDFIQVSIEMITTDPCVLLKNKSKVNDLLRKG
jgi:aminoglycoside 3-N-acetyltransferase